MHDHQKRMKRLGMFFVVSVLYPSVLLFFDAPYRGFEGEVAGVVLLSWPFMILTSYLLWVYCAGTKKPVSEVWLSVIITILLMMGIVEIVLAYNGRPVILNIDWPNWGFGIAFIAIAGLLLWLPYTRPFAVHKASGFHLIHLVLFLLPIQIFGFAFIYAFIILYASYR